MSVEEAKALLERAGVSKKHGKKDKHGKKEKKKKDKHSKREKKKRRRKDRDSDSDSDSDSESSDGGRGARRWKSGVEKTSKKGKVKDDWGPLPGPDFAIETISDEDYYLKNREFAAWLKRDRGVYFTDLSAASSHRVQVLHRRVERTTVADEVLRGGWNRCDGETVSAALGKARPRAPLGWRRL